jgi:hypothetical protein
MTTPPRRAPTPTLRSSGWRYRGTRRAEAMNVLARRVIVLLDKVSDSPLQLYSLSHVARRRHPRPVTCDLLGGACLCHLYYLLDSSYNQFRLVRLDEVPAVLGHDMRAARRQAYEIALQLVKHPIERCDKIGWQIRRWLAVMPECIGPSLSASGVAQPLRIGYTTGVLIPSL